MHGVGWMHGCQAIRLQRWYFFGVGGGAVGVCAGVGVRAVGDFHTGAGLAHACKIRCKSMGPAATSEGIPHASSVCTLVTCPASHSQDVHTGHAQHMCNSYTIHEPGQCGSCRVPVRRAQVIVVQSLSSRLRPWPNLCPPRMCPLVHALALP